MRKKKPVFIAIILFIAAIIFLSVQAGLIYLSHDAVAEAAIENLLADSEQHELALLIKASEDFNQVVAPAWAVKKVELENTVPFWQAIFDDDPIYRIKAHLAIMDTEGNQTTVVWESWRYGIVLGPLVLGLGDGPPGYVVAH